MNDRKLNRLFVAARKEAAPLPEPGFENLVLGAIRREPTTSAASVFDQLGAWFPRIAVAAGILILVSVGTDFCLTTFSHTDLSDSVTELSEQWFFAGN